MKNLIATDLTARSDWALARAFSLAQNLSGTLHAVHIVDSAQREELRTHAVGCAKRLLEAEVARLSVTTGMIASLEVCVGRPDIEVPRIAEAPGTELIVLGANAIPLKSEFSRLTSGRILRAIRKPVLLVREAATNPYHEVVVETDFSTSSRGTLQQALKLISQDGRITVVHAYHIPFEDFLGSASFRKQYRSTRQTELDGFVSSELAAIDRPGPSDTVTSVLEEGGCEYVMQ